MFALRFAALLFASVIASTCAQVPSSSDQPAGPAPATKTDPQAVRAPIPVFSPEAEFPDGAKQSQANGLCVVSLIVDGKGDPQNPRIIRCTDSIFAKSSLKAVMKYKFKPAQKSDGTPVPVMITIEVNFPLRDNRGSTDFSAPTAIRYAFSSPPGMTSVGPDSHGIYPLSKDMVDPAIAQFADKGFGRAAFPLPDNSGCRVFLTIDAKGKPSDAQIANCDKPYLEKPALESLLKSKYKPATLNGKQVPVRTTIHLTYVGFGTPNELRGMQ